MIVGRTRDGNGMPKSWQWMVWGIRREYRWRSELESAAGRKWARDEIEEDPIKIRERDGVFRRETHRSRSIPAIGRIPISRINQGRRRRIGGRTKSEIPRCSRFPSRKRRSSASHLPDDTTAMPYQPAQLNYGTSITRLLERERDKSLGGVIDIWTRRTPRM